MNLNYRKAIPDDILQMSCVLKQVYLHAYAKQGVTKQFARFVNLNFSEEKIAAEMASNQFDFWIATYDENPVGVLKVIFKKKITTTDLYAPEISKLYIMSRFYKMGIGSSLLSVAEAELRKIGEKKVWLEVWSENLGAIEFYKKVGYSIIGDSWFPIENDKYLNHVMVKDLESDG